MEAAEDTSWEDTLGCTDERTENIEKRLTRVGVDISKLRTELHGEIAAVKNAMLTKGTFLTAFGKVCSIIVAFLVYIVSNLGELSALDLRPIAGQGS